MMKIALLLLLVGVVAISYAQNSTFIQIDKDTLQFVDAFGRTRLFHGVNAVYKIPPWYPDIQSFNTYSSLVSQDMENLRDWGFNSIRLGVMWPGVSPAAQVYNSTYLEIMSDLVTQLGSYGIYTIVDCHQDIFSRYYCGEGVPDWAVPHNFALPFAEPIASPDSLDIDPVTGYPNITNCLNIHFSKYYWSSAVGNGFQHLYDNTNKLQDHFVSYWQQVAKTFKDNPYVLGYELINEPWMGDIYTNPKSLIPGHADKDYLAPMYQNLNNAIRAIDNDHIIFFESAVSDIYPAGFSEGPGGPNYNDRQAYSYHVYCAPTDADGDPEDPLFCNATLEYIFEVKQHDRRHIGVAGFMTEFGALRGTPVGVDMLNFLTDKADSQIQSWCYWQYKFFEDLTTASADGAESFYVNGELDTAKVAALSRTYAPIVAGLPTVHKFYPQTNGFQLQFTADMTLGNLTTVVYFNPEYHYQSGVVVSASSNVKLVSSGSNFKSFENVQAGPATITLCPTGVSGSLCIPN